jgi:glyoxylase-like metal-dependent hydrolase (beta-lactamase superfamily II)
MNVNAFVTVKQADALVDWVAVEVAVARNGKNLTTIYITYGHGDHWFGIGALVK